MTKKQVIVCYCGKDLLKQEENYWACPDKECPRRCSIDFRETITPEKQPSTIKNYPER